MRKKKHVNLKIRVKKKRSKHKLDPFVLLNKNSEKIGK